MQQAAHSAMTYPRSGLRSLHRPGQCPLVPMTLCKAVTRLMHSLLEDASSNACVACATSSPVVTRALRRRRDGSLCSKQPRISVVSVAVESVTSSIERPARRARRRASAVFPVARLSSEDTHPLHSNASHQCSKRSELRVQDLWSTSTSFGSACGNADRASQT